MLRHLLLLLSHALAGNGFDVASQLSRVILDHEPSSCLKDEAWRRAGLAVPPDEMVRRGWETVLQFLSAGPTIAVHELRLMLIGDGEAGKTSLQRALAAPGYKAERIGKEERTVGIDFSELLFEGGEGPRVKCQVCDFAGQEIYYLSHTLHFTRRCLYMLIWTTHKFSESGAAQELALQDIVSPLKRWLQLLAANVPDANVMVVGTHCRVDPDAFACVQQRVDEEMKEEMQRLRFIAEQEAKATFQVMQRQIFKIDIIVRQVAAKLRAINSSLRVPKYCDSLFRHKEFVEALGALSPKPARSLLLQARALLEAVQELCRTRLRLGRLHGVYDGSEPAALAGVAHLKLVNERSFAVDSVEGVGVEELLRSIEATCRDSRALPFMGEQAPVSWLQVKEALKLEVVRHAVGDCVMSVGDAAVKVQAALQQGQVGASTSGPTSSSNAASAVKSGPASGGSGPSNCTVCMPNMSTSAAPTTVGNAQPHSAKANTFVSSGTGGQSAPYNSSVANAGVGVDADSSNSAAAAVSSSATKSSFNSADGLRVAATAAQSAVATGSVASTSKSAKNNSEAQAVRG
jgi:GTPase SAR1 family protein